MQRWSIFAGTVALAVAMAGCAPMRGAHRPGMASAPLSAHERASLMANDGAHCIRDTGTFIKHREERCLGEAGRSYSAAELRRTGAANAAQALHMLDPSIY